jgi:hypothetical protein
MLKRIDTAPVLFGLVLAYILVVYPYTFNYELNIDNAYFLLTITAAACTLNMTTRLIKRSGYTLTTGIPCTIVLVLCLLLILVPGYNEHRMNLLSLMLMSSLLWGSGEWLPRRAIPVILLFFLIWLSIGMIQLSSGLRYPQLAVTGTAGNSGVYGAGLVVTLPLLWFFPQTIPMNPKQRRLTSISVYLLFSCTLFIILAVRARAPLIAFTFIASWLVIDNSRKNPGRLLSYRVQTILLIGLAVCVLTGALFLLTHYSHAKLGSLYGRLLMLWVMEDHWFYRFWWGIGLGNFTWYYPQWQAAWFHDHPFVPAAFMLRAGESYLVFNEFVLLFKEIGAIGSLALTLLLIKFYRIKNTASPGYVVALKQTVTSILLLALFSYPFHVAYTICLFIFCLTAGFALTTRLPENPPGRRRALLISNIILCTGLFLFAGRKSAAVLAWQRINDTPSFSYAQKVTALQSILPVLRYDAKFLIGYGQLLSQDGANTAKVVALLEQSWKYFLSYGSILSIARAYRDHTQYANAIERYQFLTCYIPSRFLPKYELMRLYLKTKQIGQAKKMAGEIIAMPIKVPSPEVEFMRKEALNYLKLPDTTF